jgi:hypothetical protein
MKKIQSKTLYRTSDNREYSDKNQAKNHEQLIETLANYDAALHEYGILLASQFETADGVPFDQHRDAPYFYISKPINSLPRLHEISYRWWNYLVGLDHRDNDMLFIISFVDVFGNERKGGVSYKINELYSNRIKAESVLKNEQLEWLKEMKASIEAKS